MTNADRSTLVARIAATARSSVVRGTLIARARARARAVALTSSARHFVTRERRRLASVSFGRNTDRLSKRHEATAKTNLKCLLTKQSELAALPPPTRGRERERERERALLRRVHSSLWLLSPTAEPACRFSTPPAQVGAVGSPVTALLSDAANNMHKMQKYASRNELGFAEIYLATRVSYFCAFNVEMSRRT